MVKSCVDKFYAYYESLYNSQGDSIIIDEEAQKSLDKQKEENKNAVYSMLDDTYIDYKNITLDNLTSKISKIDPLYVSVTEMYELQKDENMYVYFVYGNIRDQKTSNISKFSMIVKIDMRNRAFKVLLQDYVNEKYNNIQIGETVQINISDKNKFEHPTIKPLKFIETIIRNSSKENDIILDCFMGSGTTAVACKNTGRRYLGFEIDKHWYDIAQDRLNNVQANGQMSFFTM